MESSWIIKIFFSLLIIIVTIDTNYVGSSVDCRVIEEDSAICCEALWSLCRDVSHTITAVYRARIISVDNMYLCLSWHVKKGNVVEDD